MSVSMKHLTRMTPLVAQPNLNARQTQVSCVSYLTGCEVSQGSSMGSVITTYL